MHLFLYHGDEAGPGRVYPKMLPFFQKQSMYFVSYSLFDARKYNCWKEETQIKGPLKSHFR